MEALKENSMEIEIGSSAESFQKFLDSQSELFHSQIEKLQNVVVTQCRLTGANPLAQEMAAGALSIKIGKRPRDLLNPKAVKYMQEVFALKDAISKKESREISAQFGVTVTQVKDFFASQRTRVRKLVRLSKEKAIKSDARKDSHNVMVPVSSDFVIPISSDYVIPTDPVPSSSACPTSVIPVNPIPLNSIGPLKVDEAPSCSGRDECQLGLDDLDKHFVENFFSLMRKEETFSGQVKLMEQILRIENSSILYWFLTKGGVMILATWLSQAADEEQTSVLIVILNVLCHLPLQKALPEQMSAILQSVKRLRYYRASDLSNRANVLLSKWSKMFSRSQALKKHGAKHSTDSQNELILKQSIGEIMADESWLSSSNASENSLATLCESSESFRKSESPQSVKLLTASSDDSGRKNILGVSSSYNRERRKTQFVEQPGQKSAGRSLQASRLAPVGQARPMSADDIQKAKLKAMYKRQNKYGKTSFLSNGINEVKAEGLEKSTTQATNFPPISKVLVRPHIEEFKKSVTPEPKISSRPEAPLDPEQKKDVEMPPEEKLKIVFKEPSEEKQKIGVKEPPQEKQKMEVKESSQEKWLRVQIPWQTPPEVKLNTHWRVGNGENSKEVEVQKNRIHRETETICHKIQEIPCNPKEPWDLEMDYDDTLTPELPIEQPPDADSVEETQFPSDNVTLNNAAPSLPIPSQIAPPPQIANASASAAEPDLELLAVLLKNPELVFALTTGQAGNLSSEDTVKLLDMIKSGGAGAGLASNVNGMRGKVEEKVEVSLPSPTPSSNPGTSGWRQDVVRNPFSRGSPMESNVVLSSLEVASTEKLHTTNVIRSGISAMNVTIPQRPTSAMHPSLHQTIPERQLHSVVPSLRQSHSISSPIVQTQAMKNLPNASPSYISNVKAAPMHINAPERQPVSHPSSTLIPTSARSQPQLQPQQPHMSNPTHVASLYPSRQPMGNSGPASESWQASQRLASNSRYQVNQNNYNGSFGGPMQRRQVLSGPPRERNGYAGNDGFESWSPDNSPTRPPEYEPRRNLQEPRMNSGWSNGPDRSRQWNTSEQREVRDHNKYGYTWRDRRH